MTTPTGQALKMRTELAASMCRHNVVRVPHVVPLSEPVSHDVILQG
jgi:hypothetical protein